MKILQPIVEIYRAARDMGRQAAAMYRLTTQPAPIPKRDDTAICYAKIAAKQRGEHIAG